MCHHIGNNIKRIVSPGGDQDNAQSFLMPQHGNMGGGGKGKGKGKGYHSICYYGLLTAGHPRQPGAAVVAGMCVAKGSFNLDRFGF